VLFGAGCNEQVFSPKCLKKNLVQISLVFEKKQKIHTLILYQTEG